MRIHIKINEATPFEWPERLTIENISFLETSEENLISFLKKIIVSPNGDLYYIFDSSQGKIFVFDQSGKSMAVFDHQGEGPEEYIEITDVQIDFEKEIIEVLDYQTI